MSALPSSQPVLGRDDETLVAGVRRGEEQAFAELYERYGPRIVSYVSSMVGDHSRAEDIAQEVFISALRRMRVTERPIAFKPWIYEIARNACIDEFRRNRRSQEVPLQFDDDVDGSDRRLVSRTASPDAALENRQQLEDLRGAFGGLSESHHKVLVLRELEGLSYTQIGERLGMTRPVVESTLFRARRRLSAEYEEIASGQRCEQVRVVVDGGAERSLRSLGIRERRRVRRHLSHCQPCRRYAHAAGIDESSLEAGIMGKIAALLPIPAFLRWRPFSRQKKLAATSVHSGHAAQSIYAAARWTHAAPPGLGVERVAAAVAALAVAGGGVYGVLSSTQGRNRAPVARAPVRAAASSASQPASPPQPMGIAMAANQRLMAAQHAAPSPSRTASNTTQRLQVSYAAHVSRSASSPSSQYAASAPEQDAVSPSPSTDSPATQTQQPPTSTTSQQSATPSSPQSPLSGLTGAVTSNPSAPSSGSAPQLPPAVSQVTSSVLPPVNNVGAQVKDTVQGVTNQLTGGQ